MAIPFGPQNQVPMIGHPAVGTNSHGSQPQRFQKDSLPGRVIGVRMKQPHPPHASIQHVVHHSAGRDSGSPWHAPKLTRRHRLVNKCACPLFPAFFLPVPDTFVCLTFVCPFSVQCHSFPTPFSAPNPYSPVSFSNSRPFNSFAQIKKVVTEPDNGIGSGFNVGCREVLPFCHTADAKPCGKGDKSLQFQGWG